MRKSCFQKGQKLILCLSLRTIQPSVQRIPETPSVGIKQSNCDLTIRICPVIHSLESSYSKYLTGVMLRTVLGVLQLRNCASLRRFEHVFVFQIFVSGSLVHKVSSQFLNMALFQFSNLGCKVIAAAYVLKARVFRRDSPPTRSRRSTGSGGESSSMLTGVEGNAVQGRMLL
jgi:hypothetical protein